LLLQARFLARKCCNSPKTVWRPGSTRTPLGELQLSPRLPSRKNRGPTSKGRERDGREEIGCEGRGREGRGQERKGGRRGRKGRTKGKDGRGREGKKTP